MNRLVFATRNRNKVRELSAMLAADAGIELCSALDFPQMPEVEETGETFEENALLKAAATACFCNLPALADDSGLEVEALDWAPGVYSSRFAGEPANDEANNRKLLEMLDAFPESQRRAQFRSVIALVDARGQKIAVEEGIIRGRIDFKVTGTNGFGYDPLFIPDGFDRSFGLIDSAVKNGISHRAVALGRIKGRILDLFADKKRP